MKNSYDDTVIEIVPIDIIQKPNIYRLLLTNTDLESSSDTIAIDIGDVEATNLYFNMNSDLFKFSRPDTHDLMIKSLQSFDIMISGVIITDFIDGVWYSEIEMINTETNDKTYIEARPTDAIIIAIKLNIPINIYQSIIKKTKPKGVNKSSDVLDVIPHNSSNITKEFYKKETLSLLPLNKLEELMNNYAEKEDYESAKRVRDIIEKKKGRS